ncbi:hypothetical protein ABPG72_018268 [Tetrahymena utriculariae]
MKRQSQSTNKSMTGHKGSQVLNKGFEIFQRNQQQEQDQGKQRQSILIRTLPFIKRQHTEEYTTNNKLGGGISNSQNLNTPKEIDQKDVASKIKIDFPQIDQQISPRIQIGSPIESRNPSRQSLRYYVHNVGQGFTKLPQHRHSSYSVKNLNKVGGRFNMESPQQHLSNFGFMTYSQFQSSQTPLATAYYSTQAERFSTHHPSNAYQKQQLADEQSPDNSDYDSNNFNETQKQFFENFMQETKPLFPNDMPVLNENQINEDYQFQFQTDINKLENPNSSISFLNGFPHNFPLIENHYNAAVKFRDEYNQLKDELRKEIEEMKQKYEKDVDDFKNEAKKTSQKIAQEIQEDFVKHKTEQFSLNKEIAKLTRDKSQLESEIESQLRRVRQLEDKLYGQEIFNLVPKDPYIQNMTTQNQRQDMYTPISSKRQTQTIKNIIH